MCIKFIWQLKVQKYSYLVHCTDYYWYLSIDIIKTSYCYVIPYKDGKGTHVLRERLLRNASKVQIIGYLQICYLERSISLYLLNWLINQLLFKVKWVIFHILLCQDVKGEFAVVPTDKIERRSLSSKTKFPLIWTAYLWNCMSDDQRDLKVTYLRN